jgi:hypothetical protein
VFKWYDAQSLKINPNKSQAIIFTKQNINTENIDNSKINNEVINFVNTIKNLGLIIDSNLSWTSQVSAIFQRVSYGLHILYKFRSMTPTEFRIRLISTLLLPLFDYRVVACCNIDLSVINRLQIARKYCIRYVFNIKRNEHITSYYSKLG